MSTDIQLRGHCQRCGRLQAVTLTRGRVAQHGYEVKNGYFEGVCSGHQYEPIEIDRVVADFTIKAVRADAARLEARVVALKAGAAWPAEAEGSTRTRGRYDMVPFAQADAYHQVRAVENEIVRCAARARSARQFADRHERLCAEVHGKPLIEVARPAAPAAILYGERRVFPNGRIGTVTDIRGASVCWTDEKGFRGRTASRSWRAFAPA